MWLEKLVEVVIKLWDWIVPWAIVREFEAGIVLVLGRYNRTIGPGLHWKGPFVAEVITERTNLMTIKTDCETLTSKDGEEVVVSAVMRYWVVDLMVCILEVNEATDSADELLMGVISETVENRTWEELHTPELANDITKKIRVAAKRWGLKVESVKLTNFARMPSLRLLNGMSPAKKDSE